MQRHPALVLAVVVAASLLLSSVCDANAGAAGGALAAFGPLDLTKAIASCETDPSQLTRSPAPVDVTVTAVVLFNSSLIPSSVTVLDVTDGTASLLGYLAPAGITPSGQLFQGVVAVDAFSVGTLQLRCSAAYQGDPRRATAIASLPVVPPAVAPPSTVENVLPVATGGPVVSEGAAVPSFPAWAIGILAALLAGTSVWAARSRLAGPDFESRRRH